MLTNLEVGYIIINVARQLTHAAMAQSVERVLGKDEVGSSNLPSSSKKSGLNET